MHSFNPSTVDIDEIMRQKIDIDEMFELQLTDKPVVLQSQQAILNLLFWKPYIYFGYPITSKEVYNVKVFTPKTISEVYTPIYNNLISFGINGIDVRRQLWLNEITIYSFIRRYLNEFCESVSLLSLSKTLVQDKLADIRSMKIDQKFGTRVAETRIKAANAEFNKLLATRGAVDYNILLNCAEVGILKPNQIQQIFLMYGCRSDIDTSMMRYIIDDSAFAGLKSVEGFATEALSAKMSSYFNSVIICDTQDFARLMRLATAKLRYVYPGDCGAHRTMQFAIEPEFANAFLNRIIVEDGKRIELTRENIGCYTGKLVNLVTPILCNHADGTCEYCAGYGRDVLKQYLPRICKIGPYSVSKLTQKISQKVLSNKHLTTTNSTEYTPDLDVLKYFLIDKDQIYFKKGVLDLKSRMTLKIPLESLQPLTDLMQEELPPPDVFSHISEIALQIDDDEPTQLQMETDSFTPFLSEDALQYLKKYRRSLQIEDECVLIPLRRWPAALPIFKCTVLNYNMIAVAKAIMGFFTKQLSMYSSYPNALSTFLKLAYERAPMNSFYIEMILKSFLITSWNDSTAPIVTDPYQVRFGTLTQNASNHAITTKLSFQRVGDLFSSPVPCIRDKPNGEFDLLYGVGLDALKK